MVRRVLVALVAALVLPITAIASPVAAAEVRDITLPIAPEGVDDVHWTDTFGACRSGCSRSHMGVDMMGPKMTPLVAVADGVVSWMRHDDVKGNNIDITDADGWTYSYVHLNNDTPGTDDGANDFEFAFAPGMAQGVTVTAGQLIGYIGDSGNAESTGSHVHFEIVGPGSVNINPTPSVDAALQRLLTGVAIDDLGLDAIEGIDTPAQFAAFANQLSVALIGRGLSQDEQAQLAADIASQGLGGALEGWVDVNSRAASIDRLYRAFFLLPDAGGLRYWIELKANGNDLADLADVFATSPEYQSRYPDMSFGDFLDQLYREVLHREPDVGGRDYWLEMLERGRVTRGSIVVQFTESEELMGITGVRSEAISLFNLFDGRIPSESEVSDWVNLRKSMSLADAIDQQFDLANL